MKRIELLAPAGGMEQLQTALRFGADAVYLGLEKFGLRAFAGRFDEAALREAVALAHGLGKKIYVTLNALLFDEDLTGVLHSARLCHTLAVDAVIVSDPGAVALLRKELPGLPLHLSTQASTLNSAAAGFWHEMGVSRVIVGRELSLAGIRQLRSHTPESLEMEAFVHGAMCMSYSGRCLISSALTGRNGNQGACAQPCRWNWRLVEDGEKAKGQQLEIQQEPEASYVLSAGDLCMIEHLAALMDSGLDCLKIEGRMKSEYYVATVVGAYRRALDACEADPAGYALDHALHEELLAEIRKASHRRLDTGFYFGMPQPAGEADGFAQGAEYIAKVLEARDGMARLSVKNRFFVGDTLEALTPQGVFSFSVKEILVLPERESVRVINRPQAEVLVPVPAGVEAGGLLRGVVRNHVREA